MHTIHSSSRLAIQVLPFAPGMVKVVSGDPACTWACDHFVTADQVIVGSCFRRHRVLSAKQIADARKLIPA